MEQEPVIFIARQYEAAILF